MVPYLHPFPRRTSRYLAHSLHSSLTVDIDALTKPSCLMMTEWSSGCWLFSRMLYPLPKDTKAANGHICSSPTVLHIILGQPNFFSPKDIFIQRLS